MNASPLSAREPSGVASVAKSVMREFIAVAREHGDRLIFYTRDHLNESFPSHVEIRKLDWSLRLLWSQLRLGWELIARPPDAFLDCSNFISLLAAASQTKVFYFLHDVGFRSYPHAYPFWGRMTFRIGTWVSVVKSKVVFVPTEYTAKQFSLFYPRWREKLLVTGIGLRESFLQALRRPERPPWFSLSQPYILYVGRVDPKKNLLSFVEGFRLSNAYQRGGFCLVFCGSEGAYSRTLRRFIHDRKIRNVRFAGFVSEPELAYFYLNASLVALPSFGEGVGLPILEALAAGARVLVSSATGGISESVRDRVVSCDPTAVGIARGIDRALVDKAGPFRYGLIQGVRSWRDVAREMYSAISDHARTKG